MRIPPSLLSLAILAFPAFAACSATDGDGLVERIPSADDSRLDALNIVCESSYVLSGSFVESAPRPVDMEGECWPVGTWSVSATLDFKGCDPQKDFGGERVYEIAINDEQELSSRYPKDPNNDRILLNVLSHGGPDCEGQFDHYESDSSVWTLRPVLAPDGSISGSATYALYAEDPFTD